MIPARLVKGHGTGNDFLLYADLDGSAEPEVAEIAALCDRHTGIGADGLIRAVPTIYEGSDAEGAKWFMDYRNADGSTAQMCGNGVRVFVRFLIDAGLATLASGETLPVSTRAGTRYVRVDGEDLAVTMGVWSAPGGNDALATGFDATVVTYGLDDARPGLRIAMPNPHTVVALTGDEELDALDLREEPRVEPAPPDGTNIEFVVPLGEKDVDLVDENGAVVSTQRTGVIRMRVYERGVGETLSCGTGACAAAVATRAWFGADAPSVWVVLVPGGRVQVTIAADGQVELAGPAELVADVTRR